MVHLEVRNHGVEMLEGCFFSEEPGLNCKSMWYIQKLGTIVVECYMAVFSRTRTHLRQHEAYLLALSFDRIPGEKWHLAKDT